jgi:hypothetical protein
MARFNVNTRTSTSACDKMDLQLPHTARPKLQRVEIYQYMEEDI